MNPSTVPGKNRHRQLFTVPSPKCSGVVARAWLSVVSIVALTRECITRRPATDARTPRSLIAIALEVGYTSPSHFAYVFGRVLGVTPTDFRIGL
jgi:AraC-like DNA-binding protein